MNHLHKAAVFPIAALLISFAAVRLSSNLAPGNGPYAVVPPISYPVAEVEISATILDSEGNPWAGDLVMFTKADRDLFETQKIVNTDAAGQVTTTTHVSEEAALAGDPYTFEFWNPAAIAGFDPRDRFFTSASEGAAAFPPATVLTWDPVGQKYVTTISATMSHPSLYGTVTLTNPHGVDLSIAMQDLESTTADEWAARIEDTDRLQHIGLGSGFDVYRWSRSGGSEVAALSPQLDVLATGLLRRGGTLHLAVPQVHAVETNVDNTAYPGAFEVLIVREFEHEPNAAVATNSDVGYGVQRQRARFSFRCDFSAGNYSATGRVADDQNYVVELWSVTTLPSGDTLYYLAEAELVVQGSASSTVTFD